MRPHPSLLAPLLVLGTTAAQAAIDEGPEPNDFLGTPTPVLCGFRVDGSLTTGDFDYYAISIPTPAHVRAFTSRGKLSTAPVDTFVEIRSSIDVKIAEDDDSGQGAFSYAGSNISTPGLYYIVVRGGTSAVTGSYALDILCEPFATLEGPEPNTDPLLLGAPTPGGCGLIHQGFISPGDDDWWSFVHPGGSLTLTTGPSGPGTPPSDKALQDTILEVYDAASQLQASDDDGGESLYSSISIAALPPGLYYVKVFPFDFVFDSGWYSLRIGCGEPASLEGTVLPGNGTPPGCTGCGGIAPRLSIRNSLATGLGTRVRPRIGTTFSLDLTNLPPGSLAVHALGFGLIPPFDLAPLGAPGCFASISIDITSISFADVAGYTRSYVFIPNNPFFIGAALHWQSASLDSCHNAAGIATSNVISGSIGNIAFQ